MSIYHCSAKVIKRSEGRSAVGAAAYRSGQAITDERTGIVHDYSKKKGVDFTAILTPDHVAQMTRSELWNLVEKIEKRKDAQVAREVEVALPCELTAEKMQELVADYARSQFVAKGMIADVNIHDIESGNPHAHILLTTREITPDGFGKKNRDWNQKSLLQEWREQWEKYANHALEKAGHYARIDHRTLKEQGIETVPQIHLGPNVVQMERRGIRTGRKALWRDIDKCNAEIIDLQAARETIEKQIKEEQEELERQARARAEREKAVQVARERAEREKAEREREQEKTAQEARERAEREKAEREREQEKTAQEARERAEREKVEREREQEKTAQEARERAEREKVERAEQAARECEQEKAAKAAQERLERDPRAVEQAWVAEKLQQYAQIKPRVAAASRRAKGQLDRQAAKGKDHEKSRPEEPQGLFARLKTRDYKRKLAVWKVEESQIQARERQLETRLKRLGDLWAIRDLVAKKAAQTKPRLAGLFEKVLKKEEQEKKIEQERLETERRWKEREKADQERRRVELEKAKEAEREKAAQFKLREAQEQPKRIDFDVPYDDQAVAERLGARWDRDAKTWFISGEQVADSAFWRWHSYRPYKQERERSRGIDDDFDIGF